MVLGIDSMLQPVLGVVGLTLLSGLVAVAVAIGHRWYFAERAPAGVTLLGGVAAVAIFLNTSGALGAVAEGESAYLALEAVLFNTAAFLTAALVTPVGNRLGDRIATSTVAASGVSDLDGEVSKLVTTVGRRTAITLPGSIEELPGYDPVPAGVIERLAGRSFLFPRGLTVRELQDRLATRLKADYGVGYVDIEVTEDGTVEYLAIGQRIAGLGPTLAPGTGAVAIRGDPPNAASAGDQVQLWAVDSGEPERVATAEVRGVAGDVVTLALGDREARTIAGGTYRLLTLPTQRRPDREFADLLRAADESMATVEVEAGSDLVGAPIRSVAATVVAVKPSGGPVRPAPPRSRSIEAGDRLYLVARPEAVRRVEAASAAT